MADSKNCDMEALEASQRTRSDKESVENVMTAHGDELMNANLHEVNERTKPIPPNEDVDDYSELSVPSVRSRIPTEKSQEERIRRLKTEQITSLKPDSRKRTEMTRLMCDQNN